MAGPKQNLSRTWLSDRIPTLSLSPSYANTLLVVRSFETNGAMLVASQATLTLPVEKSKGGGPLNSEFLAIFQIRKNTKNPEISEIAISRLSHFPTFLLSASFFPRRPSRESGRRPLDPEIEEKSKGGLLKS